MEIANIVRNEIVVPTQKNGTVSKQNQRAADVMSEASKVAILSAAINGKGAVKKLAALQLQGINTVETFTNKDEIHDGQWADFLMALVARHGATAFNPATMRGKAGTIGYMTLVVSKLDNKGLEDGYTDKLIAQIDTAENDLAHCRRLFDLSEVQKAARIAAEAKLAEEAKAGETTGA